MRFGKLRSQVHVGHPFHGWLAVARNHGGRKGGSRPEILDQHAAGGSGSLLPSGTHSLPRLGAGSMGPRPRAGNPVGAPRVRHDTQMEGRQGRPGGPGGAK